jgi:hypothetical protein
MAMSLFRRLLNAAFSNPEMILFPLERGFSKLSGFGKRNCILKFSLPWLIPLLGSSHI